MMRGLKIAVCEDEPEEYEKLKRLLDESGREVRLITFRRGVRFLNLSMRANMILSCLIFI